MGYFSVGVVFVSSMLVFALKLSTATLYLFFFYCSLALVALQLPCGLYHAA